MGRYGVYIILIWSETWVILPVAEDPVDFIIELGNECEDLQYIAEKTNELYDTEYTEDDVQRIINDFIEAITE